MWRILKLVEYHACMHVYTLACEFMVAARRADKSINLRTRDVGLFGSSLRICRHERKRKEEGERRGEKNKRSEQRKVGPVEREWTRRHHMQPWKIIRTRILPYNGLSGISLAETYPSVFFLCLSISLCTNHHSTHATRGKILGLAGGVDEEGSRGVRPPMYQLARARILNPR